MVRSHEKGIQSLCICALSHKNRQTPSRCVLSHTHRSDPRGLAWALGADLRPGSLRVSESSVACACKEGAHSLLAVSWGLLPAAQGFLRSLPALITFGPAKARQVLLAVQICLPSSSAALALPPSGESSLLLMVCVTGWNPEGFPG